MALTINTNVSALTAQRNLAHTEDHLSTTLTRLSSGLRINTAKDDAAGLAIAEGNDARISGLNQAARNGNDGISLIQTAEASMNDISNLLQRMNELATEASNGTYQTSDLANMDLEFQALLTEIDRVTNVSTFNGIALLTGNTVSVQIGTNNTANDRLTITLAKTDTTTLTVNGTSLTSNANAQTALSALSTAITAVTSGLAQLGANHSNLEAAVNGNLDFAVQLSASNSRIMDTDYAAESTKLAQYQILQQSGASMLAQANASGQIVMQLLQG